jgi:uncharacterized integral membrane protein
MMMMKLSSSCAGGSRVVILSLILLLLLLSFAWLACTTSTLVLYTFDVSEPLSIILVMIWSANFFIWFNG